MGSKRGNDFETQLKVHGSKFRALGLSVEQLKALYQCFTSMDLESYGTLQLHDLLMRCDLERTAFTERVFRALDGDKGGEIEFKEFVVSLWNYATLDKNAICAFAYDLYDNDSSGSIDIAEVEQVRVHQHHAYRLCSAEIADSIDIYFGAVQLSALATDDCIDTEA
jgi:Ca2+-binding EF-hand superfamily protein